MYYPKEAEFIIAIFYLQKINKQIYKIVYFYMGKLLVEVVFLWVHLLIKPIYNYQ